MITYFETPKDVENQEKIRRKIERWANCELIGPLQPSWRADYIAVRPNSDGEKTLAAWIEIKCRSCESNKYNALAISASKIRALQKLSKHFGGYDEWKGRRTRPKKAPAMLFVHYADHVLCYINVSNKNFETCFGGRKDRGRALDQEEMFLIPNEELTEVPEDESKRSY